MIRRGTTGGQRAPVGRLGARLVAATWASAALSLWLAPAALAHVPLLEPSRPSDAAPSSDDAGGLDPFPAAVPLRDPTRQSLAVYGYLSPGERFDAYSFTVSHEAVIPIELLVPVVGGSPRFRPSFALVAPRGAALGATGRERLPLDLSRRLSAVAWSDLGVLVVPDPGAVGRDTFFEPFSVERYYRGGKAEVPVRPGVTYYVLVFAPPSAAVLVGPYTLGLGTVEHFTPADWARSLWAIVRIKLGLYGGGPLSWWGLLQLALAAGLVAAVVLLVVTWRRRAAAG